MKSFKQVLNEWRQIMQDDTKSLHDELSNHYKYPSNDPSLHQAIEGYLYGSRKLNGYHWEKHNNNLDNFVSSYHVNSKMSPSDFKNSFEDKTKKLDKVMNMNKTPKDLEVYSGTKFDPREKMNKDKVVHHPAYLSTSIAESSAGPFADKNATLERHPTRPTQHEHMLKIHIPKGHPGIYAASKNINYSEEDTQHMANLERELILPRGLNLKHIHTEEFEKDDPYNHNVYKYHLHHMEII